jgi:hypothetical protein
MRQITSLLFGIALGAFGAFEVYSETIRYLSHPHPSGSLLALAVSRFLLGVFYLFLGLRSFLGVSRGAPTRMSKGLAYLVAATVIVSGLLESFIRRQEEFWASLAFFAMLAVAVALFFAIMHARGYLWLRKE